MMIPDLFEFDSAYSEEARLAQQAVQRFIEAQVTPIINDAYEQAHFPKTLIRPLAELGVLGMTLPKAYGGLDASPLTYGVVCQALEWGDSSLRSFVSVQSSLAMHAIYAFGSDTQKHTYLQNMAAGNIIGCFGLTEPSAGSDPSSMQTFAKRRGGDWVLNGSKMWITNAPFADIAIIWAKTESGIRGFIVPCDSAGCTVQTMHHKMSLRASDTGEIFLEDCVVPDSLCLPGTEIGLKAALACLSQARFGVAWGAVGAAQKCFEVALTYVQSRQQFGKPLAAFQLVQSQLADMYTELCKAQALNLRLAELKAQGEVSAAAISMAKMNACREALKIARSARNLLGGNGISLEFDVIRHMMNLESVFTYEGTDNVHHLILGQYLTGQNAFS